MRACARASRGSSTRICSWCARAAKQPSSVPLRRATNTFTPGRHLARVQSELHPAAWGRAESREKLIQGLLTPATLLDVLRTCTVFMETDSGQRIKVVCRYQQYRAATKIIERLRSGKTPEARSGVVWHTQGSGKSLTMVFVARMLRAASDLEDFKILLVNDRVDLEQQLPGRPSSSAARSTSSKAPSSFASILLPLPPTSTW